jgi:hypothetical protein
MLLIIFSMLLSGNIEDIKGILYDFFLYISVNIESILIFYLLSSYSLENDKIDRKKKEYLISAFLYLDHKNQNEEREETLCQKSILLHP